MVSNEKIFDELIDVKIMESIPNAVKPIVAEFVYVIVVVHESQMIFNNYLIHMFIFTFISANWTIINSV